MSNLVKPDPDAQLIELWIYGRSPHTQSYYRRSAHKFLAHCDKPLASVTLADAQSFARLLADQGLADSSLRAYLAAIKSLLTFGNKLGMLPVNVGAPLNLPKAKDALNERILTEREVQLMIYLEPDIKNRAILRLLYAGGVRVSELAALKWRDLQERTEGGQVTVFGKGSKTRTILLPTAVWQELLALRGEGADPVSPLFSCTRGGHLTRQQIWEIVKVAGERVSLPNVSPHWLRHAHASHSLEHGAPIHLVQATLGHASIATTGRYLHARPTDSSSRYLAL